MAPVASHALLGVATVALVASAVRTVSPAAPRGAMRLVAAATLAAGAACVEVMLLGLAGLAGNAPVLAVAAVATWMAAVALLPGPDLGLAEEAAQSWGGAGTGTRLAAGALAGLFVTLCAWLLRHPVIGVDGLSYHLPTVIDWIHGGVVGSGVRSSYDVPTEAYPALNEALTAWAAGLAHSFVPTTLWTPLAAALSGVAAWAGLRELRVPPLPAGLATAALVTLPLSALHLQEPNNDGPALTWVACAAALAAGARRSPGLAAPALVAAGLAAGTKTTTIPLAAAAAVMALVAARAHLRRLAGPMLAGAAAALAVSAPWYVRNAVDYGSPLWPFYAVSWGDATPSFMKLFRHSLLDRPRLTLEGRLDDYAGQIAGGLVLMAGAVAAPLLARRRAVVLASVVAVLAVLAWANAPVTGAIDFPPLAWLALSSLRYLLPALGACTLALGLAAREPGVAGRLAALALAAAVVWNLQRAAISDFPTFPGPGPMAVGAGLGMAAFVLPGRLPATVTFQLGRVPSVVPLVAAAALLAIPASGYVNRHLPLHSNPAADVVARLRADARYRDGDQPVAGTQRLNAALAGDRLRHPLELIGRHEPCARVRGRLRDGWVLIEAVPVRVPLPGRPGDPFPATSSAGRCLLRVRPEYLTPRWALYPPSD